ncbi:MAG: hypothetical protein WCJ64_09430, partial [Rhodospirillaceae bacterium]
MTTPALPPERMLLPGLLMVAPLLAAVLSLALSGAVEPWAVIAAVVLPPAGAVWAISLYHREIRKVSAYLQKLAQDPGTAGDPDRACDEGEGVAHELTAAIARLDRAAAARSQQL